MNNWPITWPIVFQTLRSFAHVRRFLASRHCNGSRSSLCQNLGQRLFDYHKKTMTAIPASGSPARAAVAGIRSADAMSVAGRSHKPGTSEASMYT